MKASVVVANEDVRYMDIDEQKVGDGDVKVRVAVSGICGSDVPRVLHHGAHFYPIVLGHEFAGEVVEIGKDVTSVKPGDRVAGAPLLPCMACDDCQEGDYALCRHYSFIGSRRQGSNADYVVIPERNAIVFDPLISYEQGAMFEPSTIALHGVLQNDYRGGGAVAILGGARSVYSRCSGQSYWAQKTAVVFDICEERLRLAERLGADGTVNTYAEGFMDAAAALSGSGGYDFVFETAGVVATMKLAFDLASNRAHVCFVGTPQRELGFQPAEWENLNRKEMRLTGSWMSYSAPFPGREWRMTAEYYASGRLKFDEGLIGSRLPMSGAQEAFQMFKTPGAVKGKILLTNQLS